MHPLSSPSSASVAVRAIKDPENRSIEIGIACTILFHVLLMLLAPRFPAGMLSGVPIHGMGAAKPAGQEFDIQLMPDEAPPAPPPFKFVETNPEAPENAPDKATNFSNRDQQLAQEMAAKEIDPENRPSVQGQDAIKNDTAIVSGDAAQPQDGSPVMAIADPALQPNDAQAATKARAEQVPLAGVEKFEGDAPDGVAANVADTKKPTNRAEQAADGAPDATAADGAAAAVAERPRQVPRDRPRLTQARNTILTTRLAGTTNIGVAAIPAFRTEFGEYLAELAGIVEAQWNNILSERSVAPAPGTHALVTFTIDANGMTKIVAVEDTCGRPGVYACLSAIEDRQPYRKWSDKMIAVLGTEQTLRFSFHY